MLHQFFVLLILVTPLKWQTIAPATGSSLRGMAVSSDGTLCVAGQGPVVWVSEDKGTTWKNCTPSIDGVTDYRCVEIPGDKTGDKKSPTARPLIVASAGSPAVILRSGDKGSTWQTTFFNDQPEAFLDSVHFWDSSRGIAFGDPLGGSFLLLKTIDGGKSWNRLECNIAPIDGEAGFAASNGSIALAEPGIVLVGLGGRVDQGPSRMLRSNDAGQNWTVSEVDAIPAGPSSGVFAIAMKGEGFGIAVGGDYKQLEQTDGNIAVTTDNGATWRPISGTPPAGFRSSVIYVPPGVLSDQPTGCWLATGPSGTDISRNGEDWEPAGKVGFHALRIAPGGDIFACGSDGRVAVLSR